MPPIATRLGYLGPEGSHSHLALLGLKQAEPALLAFEIQPVATLGELLDALCQGELPMAVVPVENALEGSVEDVLEVLARHTEHLNIVAEYQLPIRHALVVQKGVTPPKKDSPQETLQNIRLMTHPQAYFQCRNTLRQHFGTAIQFTPTASTARALELLADMPADLARYTVALGTAHAAKEYGLTVCQPDMSDSESNITRFWLLGYQPYASLWPNVSSHNRENKTSFCFEVADKPGALVDSLMVLKEAGINMVRIESRPSRRGLGQYVFFVDLDATGSHFKNIEPLMKPHTQTLSVLGSYPVLSEKQFTPSASSIENLLV